MKKLSLYIFILTVCCLLIGGCSSSADDETSPSSEAATETIITEAESGNASVSVGSDEVVSETDEICTDENCEHDRDLEASDQAIEIPEPVPHGGGGNSGGYSMDNTTNEEEEEEDE